MAKNYLFLIFLLFISLTATAQTTVTTPTDLPLNSTTPSLKYAYLRVDSLFRSLPEYQEQTERLKELRQKYVAETEHNEADFKRQFAEYLNGQTSFPPTILMKRQRDLQEAMEKSLAFRLESEELLQRAETEMRLPLRQRLMAAIQKVGANYALVLNLDSDACPYVSPNPAVAEDITELVKEVLSKSEGRILIPKTSTPKSSNSLSHP